MYELLNIELFFSNIYNALKSLFKVLFLSKFYAKIPEIETGDCVILGNGPSLTASLNKYKDQLKNKKLIAVNHFPETDIYTSLKPSYLVLLDRGFWEYDESNPKHAKYLKLFDALITKTTWNISVCIDAKAKKRLQWITDKNPNVTFTYFNKNGINSFDFFDFFFWKKTLASPRCWNVLIATTYICVNLKFKNIYILGADHSWFESLHVSENNETMIKQLHFYDKEKVVNYVPYVHSETNKNVPIQDLMYMYHMVFKTYNRIDMYALKNNSKIINSSETSYIDAFERGPIF